MAKDSLKKPVSNLPDKSLKPFEGLPVQTINGPDDLAKLHIPNHVDEGPMAFVDQPVEDLGDPLLNDPDVQAEIKDKPGLVKLLQGLVKQNAELSQQLQYVSNPKAYQKFRMSQIVNDVMDETRVEVLVKRTGRYTDGTEKHAFRSAGEIVSLRKPFARRLIRSGAVQSLQTV